MRVAHLTLDLGFRHQRGDRIDDNDVDGAGPDQRFRDLQGLLAVIGLGDQQIIDVHSQLLGVLRIHSVFRVDERGSAAPFLRLGHGVERDGGFAAAFRSEDLDYPAPGQTADAQRQVERQHAGRNDLDVQFGRFAHFHDRALAEILLDLRDGDPQGFRFPFAAASHQLLFPSHRSHNFTSLIFS